MTTLPEGLENKKLEAKRQMRIHKPTIGFLGSKYYYWEKIYNSL
jgi:hypothetical protein